MESARLSSSSVGIVTTFAGCGPLVIADEDGRPDYSAMEYVDTQSTYLDGTSMGSASNYPTNGVILQNNFPDEDAGYYGAASNTTPFDNDNEDAGNGSSETTSVQLRYTIELQRPNQSQLKYLVDYDQVAEVADADEFSDIPASEQKSIAVEQIDGLEESDIDEGNSRLVMEGEDGYQSFDSYGDGAGIPYNVLRNNTDHVGIIVETAQFGVTAQNLGSDSGVTGSSNAGAK